MFIPCAALAESADRLDDVIHPWCFLLCSAIPITVRCTVAPMEFVSIVKQFQQQTDYCFWVRHAQFARCLLHICQCSMFKSQIKCDVFMLKLPRNFYFVVCFIFVCVWLITIPFLCFVNYSMLATWKCQLKEDTIEYGIRGCCYYFLQSV